MKAFALLLSSVAVNAANVAIAVTCNNGALQYLLNGNLFQDVNVTRGDQVTFTIDSATCSAPIAHPFRIDTTGVTGGQYLGSEVTNNQANGVTSGAVVFLPNPGTPSLLIYKCVNHPTSMHGNINVFDATTSPTISVAPTTAPSSQPTTRAPSRVPTSAVPTTGSPTILGAVIIHVECSGFLFWLINGAQNPTLSVTKGQVVQFVLGATSNCGAHPFRLITPDNVTYTLGTTNNVAAGIPGPGHVTIRTDLGTPSLLRYQCTKHINMIGNITLTDPTLSPVTQAPSRQPTTALPTVSPTTQFPSKSPSLAPTSSPSNVPTPAPSSQPSKSPSSAPPSSTAPSSKPNAVSSTAPTAAKAAVNGSPSLIDYRHVLVVVLLVGSNIG